MRWRKVSLLTGLLACLAWPAIGRGQPPAPRVVRVRAAPVCATADLPSLWQLALAHNPELREAAAEVEEARGRRIQAAKYPNPTVSYSEDALGGRASPAGVISLQMTQEIVTGGKRRLDRAVAAQDVHIASVSLTGRRFEVLTAVRRAWYEYLAAEEEVRVQDENVATLQESVDLTRRLVEDQESLPRADLLHAQARLAEARVNQTRNHVTRSAAWRQLAAEVGMPDLPPPVAVPELPTQSPAWDEAAVLQRVLAANADLHEATLEVERSRLEWQRARAGAVPNVTVGGGWVRDFVIEGANGGIVSVETPLPLWDRNQGEVCAAKARWARAQAAVCSTADRLRRETAEAFGRYLGARQQAERLTAEVLPVLEESLRLVRKPYRAGKNPEGFVDVQTAAETLNDTRLARAEARRALWEAVADLQGLMQIDVGEESYTVPPVSRP